MTDPNIRKEMLEEIIARKKLGDKKFHSETSLQQFGEDEKPVSPSPDINKDPGVEFDTHDARSLQVVPKELPSGEESIAHITGYPEKSRYAILEREIAKDIKAHRSQDYVKALSRSVPHRDQWYAPRNHTKEMWRSARHVPKDLVTLKTVWEGITNLRSVKEYCRWMNEHPEYRRAPYLSSLGMFDPAVLQARFTFESQHGLFSPTLAATDTAPAPIDHLRKRLSQLADTT